MSTEREPISAYDELLLLVEAAEKPQTSFITTNPGVGEGYYKLGTKPQLIREVLRDLMSYGATLQVLARKVTESWRLGTPGRPHFIDEDDISNLEEAIAATPDFFEVQAQTLEDAAFEIEACASPAADPARWLRARAQHLRANSRNK